MTQHLQRAGLAAPSLFLGIAAEQPFATRHPTVLGTEPAGARYVARRRHAENPPAWVRASQWNSPVILRYYAAQDAAGQWKLENAWANQLAGWSVFATRWARFHYPPSFRLRPALAAEASAFCDSVVTALHLPAARPFDFYVTNSAGKLGQLFNMAYWLAYNTSFAQKIYNRTLSGRGRVQHRYEFVHLLCHPVANFF